MSELITPSAKAYSVSRLNSYIREMFDYDAVLNSLFVEAELSNFKAHGSGHLYFTVKDEHSSMRAVMFREAAMGLTFAPEDGMKVVIYGSIGVYEKAGQYQLYAEMMQPLGLGALHAAFEALKKKLAAEGLFDQSRKRALPKEPKCVALVTAPEGAAVRDMINVIRRRDKAARIVISPTAVQGAGAAGKIAAAIKLVNDWGGADVIIVGRGGGSVEDLWAFNEEVTARAICYSRIPVISAVGHETDVTIADFAADLRAPTPSAAAELAVPLRVDAGERAARLWRQADAHVARMLADARGFTIAAHESAERAVDRRVEAARLRLLHGADGLEKLSPLGVMRRGYAAVSAGGRAVTGAAGLSVGDELSVTFADGAARARILEVSHGDKEG